LMNAMLASTLEPLDPVPIRGFNGPEDMQLTPDRKHIVVSELRRACLLVGRELRSDQFSCGFGKLPASWDRSAARVSCAAE
jgi:hypothetical protein